MTRACDWQGPNLSALFIVYSTMERLENYLVKSLERDLGKPYCKPLQKLSLLPKPIPAYVKYDVGQCVQGIFVFWTALVLLAFLSLMLYLAFLVHDPHSLHQIQKHWRTLLPALYAATKGPLVILLLIPFVFTLLSTAMQYPALWAWNRRAERLSHTGLLPALALDNTPGVWPPPPSISAPADAPPRI